jgi:hypothetical protein
MSINLTISLSHPAAIATQVRYARIDNLAPGQAPVFTAVPNLVGGTGVFTIASDLPAGQYQVNYTPVYSDGRTCTTYTYYTPACPGLISISATIQTGVIVVTYLAPSGATNVIINVAYPNGGSFSNMYVNDGNPISIGLPSGVYGNFSVTGQAVCDPTSGFYSATSSTVIVNNAQAVSGSYQLGNTIAAVCGATTTTLYSAGSPVPGSTLYSDQGLTTPIVGYTLALYQGIVYNLSSTTGVLGTNSGLSCNINITGNTALSEGIPNGSGLITGPAGATVTVGISASGPPGGTYTMSVSIPAVSFAQSVSNGNATFTFTMPPSGSVAWIGLYTSTNSSGGGSVSV